ncbi:hypothetical protein ACTPDI_06330 [Clostridioides difficile]|nr:hypothetical protein [Clostridioides difficile]MDB0439812.1 hypothetical protein [Clostridioides difficile]
MIIIRSQDKTNLMEVSKIEINENQIYVTFEGVSNTKKVGDYESKERAMQVLDKIQNFIESGTEYDYITANKVRYNVNRIFQMPIK